MHLYHYRAAELRKGLLVFHQIIQHEGKDLADVCALRVDTSAPPHYPIIPATDDHRNWLYLGFLELLAGADWPPATTDLPNQEGKWIIFATPRVTERNES